MFEIVKNIPKPETTNRQAGSKYPLGDMSPGDAFFVPKSEMQDGDTPEKFRNRIYQSVRNFAMRTNKLAEEGPQNAASVKKEFAVLIMTKIEDNENGTDSYAVGDVGVWRVK